MGITLISEKGKTEIPPAITVPTLVETAGNRFPEQTCIIFTCLQKNSRI